MRSSAPGLKPTRRSSPRPNTVNVSGLSVGSIRTARFLRVSLSCDITSVLTGRSSGIRASSASITESIVFAASSLVR